MKKLLAFALALCLLAASAALAEGANLRFGYIAPSGAVSERHDRTVEAFLYAADRKGVATEVLRYDPAPADTESAEADNAAEPAETTEPDKAAEDPAVVALNALIGDGIDGVAAVPTTLDQAKLLVERAHEAGVPIVIEGMDLSPAYPPDPDPDNAEERPYVAAVTYGDSAAYTAAKWLEEHAYSPLVFHCMLPEDDPVIQSGFARALDGAQYLELAGDVNAPQNSAAGGREALQLMYNSYTMFYCVLADSAALGAGCRIALKEESETMPVAAIDDSANALLMVKDGTLDMVASAPASVEGVRTFQALHDYLTEGTLPENETRLVALTAITTTVTKNNEWVSGDDFEAAYALAYPDEATAETK